MTSCGHQHEDGAYVLGALSPEDRVAFERHLPRCPECAQSVRELAGLPGLLARVPVEILEPAQLSTPVPETLLPGLVRRVGSIQRRRRRVTGGLVAAAVLGAVAIGAAGMATFGDDNAPAPAAANTAAPRLLKPLAAVPISGWLSVTAVGWGTRLDLTCSYAETSSAYGVGPVPTYTMFVIRGDGTSEQVASWRAIPGRTMHLAGATAARIEEITDVEVRTSSGQTVLELN